MRVSLHALSRWRERIDTGLDTILPDAEIVNGIKLALSHSRMVQLRSRKERISKLLRHGVETSYHQHGDQVFVVAGGNVVSVYLYEKSRWEAVK